MISSGGTTITNRRTFSPEFKLATVKIAVELGMYYGEAARDLGIRYQLVSQWR